MYDVDNAGALERPQAREFVHTFMGVFHYDGNFYPMTPKFNECFDKYDKDNSGLVQKCDFRKLCKELLIDVGMYSV